MPPLGQCPRRIAPAAAMVKDFEKKRKNTTKTQLLPSFFMVDLRKKAINFETHQGPSTHVIDTTDYNSNLYATSQAEMINYILSYQT
jgi:hypothetical protein